MATIEKPPSRTAPKFVIRMPDGLRDRLRDKAGFNHRSVNSEVIARLLRTLDDDDRAELGVKEPYGPRLNELESRLLLAFRALPEEKKKALLDLLK